MQYYNTKKYLNKADIEFLEKLEVRLNKQAETKGKSEKDKLLISKREFEKFWTILDKIEHNYADTTNKVKEAMKTKRKADKSYGRPNYYKRYLQDKENAKLQGLEFNKTIKDYKED